MAIRRPKRCFTRPLPKFFHERDDAKSLFATLASEQGYPVQVVEKDYWLMHCLWGLQQNGLKFEMKGGTSLSKGWGIISRFSEDIDIRFDAPSGLNLKGDKPAHIKARFDFYDGLAESIQIPSITAERNRAFDDEKAQNGGISLKYQTRFDPLDGLRPEVLLEAGFTKTAPNEPRDFSSWALEKALTVGLPIADNRAHGVLCFNPEYTFVDKLQTISRRFRQHKARGSERDRPREFLRHYYDLFMLLGDKRVRDFIGTPDYEKYKAEKIKGEDAKAFAAREPFTLPDPRTFELFEREYEAMKTLLLGQGPTFKETISRFRDYASKF